MRIPPFLWPQLRIEFNTALGNISGLCGATVNGTVAIRLSDLTLASLSFCAFAVLVTKADLEEAVDMYVANPYVAEVKYGPIGSWDLGMITDLSNLFTGKSDFNADIGAWKVSHVKNMGVRLQRLPSHMACWIRGGDRWCAREESVCEGGGGARVGEGNELNAHWPWRGGTRCRGARGRGRPGVGVRLWAARRRVGRVRWVPA